MDELTGPPVEPITYPGYGAKDRKALLKAQGLSASSRGGWRGRGGRGGRGARGRGRGRGRRGAAHEPDAALTALLAQAPDTELDNFYPRAILDEKYVRDQRQYQVSWHESVTARHKRGNKTRISKVVQESADGKFALVEWKDTWEKASEMDNDESAAELRRVWRQQCVREGKTTPLPPPDAAAHRRSKALEAGEEEDEEEAGEEEEEEDETEDEEKEAEEDRSEEEEINEDGSDEEASDESSGDISEDGVEEFGRILASQVCTVHDLVLCAHHVRVSSFDHFCRRGGTCANFVCSARTARTRGLVTAVTLPQRLPRHGAASCASGPSRIRTPLLPPHLRVLLRLRQGASHDRVLWLQGGPRAQWGETRGGSNRVPFKSLDV